MDRTVERRRLPHCEVSTLPMLLKSRSGSAVECGNTNNIPLTPRTPPVTCAASAAAANDLPVMRYSL